MAEYTDSQGEPVKPLSSFYSTALSPRVSSYDTLATRIAYALGYPLVNVEIHTNAIYDNISIACEMYAKFAGYTEEFLVFDSDLYESGKGIRLDKLFSITPDLSACYDGSKRPLREDCDPTTTTEAPDITGTQVTCSTAITSTETTGTTATTGTETTGTTATTGTETTGTSATTGTEVSAITASEITGTETTCVTSVTSASPTATTTEAETNECLYNIAYDYDLNDYRKVIDVWSFTQGTHTGVNTLFTLEQSLAQQTYFSYAMGNYGFDLVSWYAVKEWLELREKLLATRPSIMFNERTQYMKLIPEPRNRYYGIVACYVEAPVRDLVKNMWVYQYSLALTKMVVGRVRGKYGNTSLVGGGNIDGESLISEGKEERAALEKELYEVAPGLGDSAPPQFFVA